jgi:hypothetical protein
VDEFGPLFWSVYTGNSDRTLKGEVRKILIGPACPENENNWIWNIFERHFLGESFHPASC